MLLVGVFMEICQDTDPNSLYWQAIDKQMKTDEEIAELTSGMEGALKYVDIVKGSDGLTEALQEYIEAVLRQIVECAIFIRQYCQPSFIGKRVRDVNTLDMY